MTLWEHIKHGTDRFCRALLRLIRYEPAAEKRKKSRVAICIAEIILAVGYFWLSLQSFTEARISTFLITMVWTGQILVHLYKMHKKECEERQGDLTSVMLRLWVGVAIAVVTTIMAIWFFMSAYDPAVRLSLTDAGYFGLMCFILYLWGLVEQLLEAVIYLYDCKAGVAMAG